MNHRRLLLAGLAVLALSPALAAAPAGIAGAVADASRPDADKARDADRKPAEMLAFAQVKPGQTVVDYLPGKGYFTRLFSDAVGPKGKVYAVTPQLLLDRAKNRVPPPPVSGEAGHSNVHEAVAPDGSLGIPGKADLVWTSQNYHDVHIWAGAEGTAP